MIGELGGPSAFRSIRESIGLDPELGIRGLFGGGGSGSGGGGATSITINGDFISVDDRIEQAQRAIDQLPIQTGSRP